MNRLLILMISSTLLMSCSKNIYQQKEQYIKFKYTRNRIFFKLKVKNSKEGNFCFDTGANRFLIDSTFFKENKMSFNYYAETNVKGVGDIIKMIKVNDTINFSIKNNVFTSTRTVIHHLKKSLGKNIDGIFGVSHFGKTPFKIDYLHQKIILNPKIDDRYQEVLIRCEDDFMYLPMEVRLTNGTTIKGDFVVDTGARESVLTNEFTDNINFLNNKKATYQENGGIGGIHLGYSLFVEQIKISEFRIINQRMDVSSDNIGALAKNNKDIGIIGNDILDHFDIIYHPTQNKIWIKPNKNFNKPSEDLYKSFILIETIDKDKGCIVAGIYEDTDAYQKGLRHKDEVVEINNKRVQKMDLEKFQRKLKPNQKIKLKVKRGNEFIEIDTYLNVFLRKMIFRKTESD